MLQILLENVFAQFSETYNGEKDLLIILINCPIHKFEPID